MLKEIIIAIQAYFKAHKFIQKNRLWKWILIPGLLYASLFFLGMIYFVHTANDFFNSLSGWAKGYLTKIDSTFLGFIITLGGVMVWLTIVLFYFSLFKFFYLIVGSPVFAYLSEKTEAIIEGKDFPFSFSQLLKDIVRGVKIAIRNALWQTVYIVFLLLLSLFPVLGWFAPITAMLVEFYYYGFSMLDYSMERHKKTASQSIAYIGNHKGLAIGNGAMFYAMHLIPIIGWLLAPAYAVVAATISMYPLKEKQNN